jgi:hypothetical protein
MRVPVLLAAASVAAVLPGCATLTEGTKQSITVEVSPKEGICILTRNGQIIAQSTPQMRVVQIEKANGDIIFDCSAPGYDPRQIPLSSALSNATVVSFFLLDFGIVDTISGAAHKYPERITVVLDPIPPPPPAPRTTKQKR